MKSTRRGILMCKTWLRMLKGLFLTKGEKIEKNVLCWLDVVIADCSCSVDLGKGQWRPKKGNWVHPAEPEGGNDQGGETGRE